MARRPRRQKKKTPKQNTGSPKLEVLEPRVLLSTFTVAPDSELDEAMRDAESGPRAIELSLDDADAATPEEVAAVESRTELVFVDTGVENYQALVDDLRSSSPEGRTLEVFLLDAERDGIAQISEILSDYQGLDAIHIVSHGSEGAVQLGDTWLSEDTLASHETALAGWSESLTETADLLFYGCDLAANESGEALVAQVAKLTGADVAASDDLTGAAALGGDWVFEASTGAIETRVAFSEQAQQSWEGVLESFTATQDAAIKLKEPTTNTGADASMVIDRETNDLQRGLVQFDLSSIPPGSTITSATLKLQSTDVGGSITVDVYQVLEAWSEGTVTWDSWSTAGGVFDPTAVDSITTSSAGQHSFDVTALVQDWVDGTEANNGLLIGSPDGGGNRTVTYDSREGGVAPILEVTFQSEPNTAPTTSGIPDFSVNEDPGFSFMDLKAHFEDLEDPDTDLVYTIEGNTNPALFDSASIVSGSTLRLDYAENQNGVADLTIRATDTGGLFVESTFSVTVNPVNDDPTNAGGLPSDLVFLQDTQGKLDLSAIDLSDVDAGSSDLTLTITSANGHLQTLGWPGLTLGGSQSVLILTGNLTDLNDFLNDATAIDYEHATPGASGNNVDLITIEITDNGNTGSGGGATIELGTVNIDVTPSNTAPVNSVPSGQYTAYGTSLVFSAANGNAISISDTESGAAPVQVTLDVAHGVLTLSGTTGLTFTSGGDGSATMTFSGTQTDVNTALDGLTYSPSASYRGLEELQIVTNDLGSGGAGTPLTDSDTVALHVGALVVTNTSDLSNGDTSSVDALTTSDGGDGISLREAILAINASGGADHIYFDVAGGGPHTIALTSALPTITETMAIDGSSEPDFGGTPMVVLDGSGAGAGAHGLTLSGGSDGSTIRGLVIRDFEGTGIGISGSGSHTIAGNYIGTDGTTAAGNLAGIRLDGSANNIIGGTTPADRNVIAGNDAQGILLTGATTTGNVIEGNYIGLDAAGTATFGNLYAGIWIGNSASGNQIGGTAAGSGNVIAGHGAGIQLLSSANSNTIQGNRIGTDYTGTVALGNNTGGIRIYSGAFDNTIGGTSAGAGNLISGNGGAGVGISDGIGNAILGNLIGTDVTGTLSLGNAAGVRIEGSSTGNIIGGTAPGAGNVISGNLQDGVLIQDAATTGTLVQGNHIGTDTSGTKELGNGESGIEILRSSDNIIGGTSAAARNIISGNVDGIFLSGVGATGNVVQGNYIGTDATGTADLGNSDRGVQIESGANDNLIGGIAAGAGNLISGNDNDGVIIADGVSPGTGTTGNAVQGNLIGTDATGAAVIGNTGHGVHLTTVDDNLIGGADPGAGNIIAGSSWSGVLVQNASASGNAILRNVIYGSGGLAIDLGNDGVTGNDIGDGDAGANELQNTPGIKQVLTDGSGSVTIAGVLESTPNTSFRIEFFANTTPDGSGYGEAERYLGATMVTTDATGSATFSVPLSATLAVGEYVTATATVDLGSGDYGSTSEFSENVAAAPSANQAPVADAGGPYTIAEGEGVLFDASGTADANGDSLTYRWDLDNDGIYGDLTSTSPSVGTSWNVLSGSYGINDDGTYTIGLQVDDGAGGITTTTTTLTVTNVAPVITATGPSTVGEGSVYVLDLSAVDPGADTIAKWTINWGDGSITTVDGSATEASHVYGLAGMTYEITVSATDEDGTFTSSDLLTASDWNGHVLLLDGNTGDPEAKLDGAAMPTRPASVAIGPDGDYYVVSSDTNSIIRFDAATGSSSAVFVSGGSGGLSNPFGIAFGPDGNLYVASYNSGEVLRYDGATGAFMDVFVSDGEGGVGAPSNVEFGPAGMLYVTDWFTGKVHRFDAAGDYVDDFADTGGFGVTDVAFGPNDTVYVSNANANQVYKYDSDGVLLGSLSAGSAYQLEFGPDGSLYVSRWSSDAIERFDVTTMSSLGIFADASDELDGPWGIEFTPDQQVTILAHTAPSAQDDSATVPEGGSVLIDLAGNDSAGDDPIDPAGITIVSGPVNGSLVLNGDGTVSYIHDGSETLADSFSYTIADTTGAASDVATVSLTITPVNDAPVLDGSVILNLDPVVQDSGAPVGAVGTLVSSLVDFAGSGGHENITDADAGAVTGIAITQAATGMGSWYYSTDDGATWNALVGVSESSALLLAAEPGNRVYFQPNPGFSGLAVNPLNFRAWDQTSGTDGGFADASVNGGSTAFSAVLEYVSAPVTVNQPPTAVNDAATVGKGGAVTIDLAANDTDADSVLNLGSVVITSSPANGTLVDHGDGTFTYTHDGSETLGDSFSYTIRDAEGATSNVASVTLTVTPQNDAPALSGGNDLTAIDEDPVSNTGTLVSDLIAGHVTDADTGDPAGIAVVGVDDTNGTWEYTTDGGGTWTAFGAVDSSSARLLAADANTLVRFVPDADWNGTVTNGITFHAWDQTRGAAGGTADLTKTTLLDQFETVSYETNDGTAEWTGSWTESSDDGLAGTGNVRIEGGKLRLDSLDGGDRESITRAFDLSGATSGALTLDYNGWSEGGTDRFAIEVSNDGGASWVLLEDVTATPDTNFSGSGSYDLAGAVSFTSDMVVRLSITQGFAGTTQHVLFDNVQIEATGMGTGGSTAFSAASASSSIAVAEVNDAPLRTGGTVANLTVAEDSGLTSLGLAGLGYGPGGGADEAGQNLTYEVTVIPDPAFFGKIYLADGTTQVTTGSYTLAELQGMQFEPAPNANGGPSFFEFRVVDDGGTANGGSDRVTESLQISITPVNDSPTAVNDTATVNEGESVTFSLTGNDTDPDSALNFGSIVITSLPANGTLVDHGDGTFTYTHDGTETLGDSFSYTIQDANGATSNVASVTLTITPVNDPPSVAYGEGNKTYVEDAPPLVIDALATVADPDSGDFAGGTLTFDIAANSRAGDQLGIRNQGTGAGQVGVSGSNVTYGGIVVGTWTGGGDQSTPLVVTFNAAADASAVEAVARNVTFHNTSQTPATSSRTIRMVVTDGDGGTSNAVTKTISAMSVNDTPTGGDDSYSTAEETPLTVSAPGILANDVDLDGHPITAQLETGPSNGSLVLNADGSFTYTPDADFAGTDSFTYVVRDASSTPSDPVTVTIDVTPINDAPVRTSGTVADLTVEEDSGLTSLGLAGLAYGPGGGADEAGQNLTVEVTVIPDSTYFGKVYLADGTTQVTTGKYTIAELQGMQFEPAADESGGPSFFSFRIYDDGGTAGGGSDFTSESIQIHITPTNDAPVLTLPPGNTSYVEGSVAFVTPSASLTDVDSPDFDGGQLVVTIAAGGEATDRLYVNSEGTGPGQVAASGATVSYNDGSGSVVIGTISGGYGSGDPLVITFNAAATESGVAAVAEQVLFWNTSEDPSATSRTVTMQVTDGDGDASAVQTRTIDVTPQNDAPTAVDDTATVNEGESVTFSLTGNDTDPDSTLNLGSIVITSLPANGTLVDHGDGTFTYTHDGTETLGDSFSYTIQDANGATSNVASVALTVIAQNDAPTATDDTATVNEGESVTFSLTGNDSDPDSALNLGSIVITSPPGNGTLVDHGDGTFTYTHDGTETLGDSFSYTIQDANGATSNVASVTLTVIAQNDAPTAVDDTATVNEGESVTFSLTGNDSDPDSALNLGSIVITSMPANGTLVDHGDGTFTYTHDGTETLGDSFSYTIQDANGATSNVASVTLTVIAQNDAPTAADDTATVNEGESVTFSLTGNDSDPDSALNLGSIVITSMPANGTLVDHGDGTFTYTHDGTETLGDSFSYTIQDANGATSNVASVTLTVIAQNDAPTAVDDTATVNEGESVTFSLTGNDSDPDSALNLGSIVITSMPANGTLVDHGDGTFTYTHDGTETLGDSFSYTIQDANGATSNVASVTLTVIAQNDAPTAVDDTATVNEGESVTFSLTGNDSDPDSALNLGSIVITSPPGNGTLVDHGDGTFTYTHDGTETLGDSFSYTIQDANGATSNVASVTLTVIAQNDAPTATDDTATVNEGESVTFSLTGNDSDPDSALNLGSIVITSLPANGTLVDHGDGTFTYTHDGSETLGDSFSYTIQDANGATSNVASVTLTVIAQNDAPTAVDDTATVNEGESVTFSLTGNDSDPDSALNLGSIVITSPPGNGTLVDHGDGTFTYTHDGTETLGDSFSYTIQDANGATSNVASVTLTVIAQNDAPTATDDTATVNEGESVTFSLTGNDSDPDSALNLGSIVITSLPANGTLVDHGDGTFTYTHDGSETLGDSFSYTIQDANGATSNVASVTLTVIAQNDAPTAVDDTATVNEGESVTFSLTGNDSDPDSALNLGSIVITSLPANGTLVDHGDGTFTYTHDGTETLGDSFSYTIQDANGATSNVASVTLTVIAQNDAPTATDDTATVNEGESVTFSLTGNDSDPDSALNLGSIVITSLPANGTLVDHGDGTFTYTHDGSETLGDSFSYTIQDANGATSNVASVTLTVIAQNDAPTAVDDTATVNEGESVTFSLTGNDSDPDSALNLGSIVITSLPANGTLVDHGDGTFTYTHDGSETLGDSFSYTIQDANGATSNVASVTLTVIAQNDAPTAVDDTATVNEGESVTFSLTGNDSDPDSALNLGSIVITSLPANGTLVDHGDGTFTYTHDGTETLGDSFSYTIQDANGATSNVASVTLTVIAQNDAPTAVDDTATVNEGESVTFSLTGNDSDPDSALNLGSIVITSLPANGTLVDHGDGTFTYTHDGTETLGDSFSYTIQDANGATSNVASVTLTVIAQNDAPTAVDDTATVNEGESVTFSLTGNDTDPDSVLNLGSIVITSLPANGTLVDHGDGTFTYTHDGTETLGDSFSYTIQDANGTTSNVASVTLTVIAQNDDPLIDDQELAVDENTAAGTLVGSVAASDPDLGDSLAFAITSGNFGGAFAIDPNSGDVFVANPASLDFEATPEIVLVVEVEDLDGARTSANVTVTIRNLNEPIQLSGPDSLSLTAGESVVLSTLDGNAISVSDLDGADAPLEVTLTASGGVLTLGSTDGITILTGTGSADSVITFQGSASAVGAALDGLLFEADGSAGAGSIDVDVADLAPDGRSVSMAVGVDVKAAPEPAPEPVDEPTPEVEPPAEPRLDELTLPEPKTEAPETPETASQGRTGDPTSVEAKPEPAPVQGHTGFFIERSGGEGHANPDWQRGELPFEPGFRALAISPDSIQVQIDGDREARPVVDLLRPAFLNADLFAALDQMRRDVLEAASGDADGSEWMAPALEGMTLAATTGLLAAVLRSGSLMAMGLSSVPLWKRADPLTVLSLSKEEREDLEASLRAADSGELDLDAVLEGSEEPGSAEDDPEDDEQ